MGNRVAELRTPGTNYIEGYAVYQSTAMAMFSPIFQNHLAAELFASTLQNIHPRWSESDQMNLAAYVNGYIFTRFGEQPEEHEAYDAHLSSIELFAEMRGEFLACWSKVTP